MDNTSEKPSFQWDDEKLAAAVRLKGEGLSASEIAGELGTTKGSVQGKLRRTGHARGAVINTRPKYKAPPPDRRQEAAVAAAKRKYRCLDIMALQSHHCRWIVADRPTLYCGHRKRDGSSYCPHHTGLAWRREV
jgi:hypothetical protein